MPTFDLLLRISLLYCRVTLHVTGRRLFDLDLLTSLTSSIAR